ncbi:MAG: amidophosphoribosyltransferase [Saprospiraceae bacterium]|nr:amidophosphoribosyltransferase [Saprospiraceae bacterium]
MSDQIKHECGIAIIRLLKPLDYYQKKYNTAFYGLNKLHLLMQKMRNRGQDGAGIASIKLDPPLGTRYVSRRRSNITNPIRDVFEGVFNHFEHCTPEQLKDTYWLKENMPYIGELLMGHLRYGTHGKNIIENVHPFLRQNNWISRNLVLAGNFNLTNADDMFDELVQLGQYPKEKADTVTVLEKIGHFLDDEVQRLHTWFKKDGYTNIQINTLIEEHLDIQRVLTRACKHFDGGYAIGGLIGHGDAFLIRDAKGIRPAFYYQDDEIVAIASERPALQTTLDVHFDTIKEVKPGHALIIKKNGTISELPFTEQKEKQACSFERIYFSRGTDKEIYLERKKLGEQLALPVLDSVDFDLDNTVFSFVPNTAETAFYGLIKGLEHQLNLMKEKEILALKSPIAQSELTHILQKRVRVEKLVVKDEKIRTFIADDRAREEMVSHVYDVTYGIVRNEIDTLVLLDDSIVRGTTLRESIIRIVSRLRPKKIIIVSSSPQIRYPDCYGIDMSKLGEFVAFQALVQLLKESHQEYLIKEAYDKAKLQQHLPTDEIENVLIALYNLFDYEVVSKRIAQIVTPVDILPEIEVIFQTIDGLHAACPDNSGDWYFSGNYPTPGGNKVVNQAFINFVENKNQRAY